MKTIENLIPDDSWLKEWLACWPLSESPKSFILIAGMSALGAGIQRRAWIDMDYRKIYPMLNTVFTGPSGLGKTEAIELAKMKLLKALPAHQQPMLIEGSATREKLHTDLVLKPHAVVVAEEMATFFNKSKYMETMVPFVTELLNYKDEVARHTKNGDEEIIKEPAVTFQCGSTVDWLQKMLPDSAVGGGFLPRFLVVYEEHKSQIVPLPQLRMNDKQRAALDVKREECAEAFRQLVLGVANGPFGWQSHEAMNTFEMWVINHKAATGHLAPFSARAREFVLRLSMLVAISRGHKSIQTSDVNCATAIYEWAIAKLQKVVVPMTPEGELQMKVLELFESGSDTMTDRQVIRAMRNYLRAKNTREFIESLVESGDLVRLPDQKLRRNFKA